MTGLANSTGPLAVLASGGVDSAILLADALQQCSAVYPLYVRAGHFWEPAEREHLDRLWHALARPALQPLQVLEVPVADLYGRHWSLTGRDVPDACSADEAVFLPGRNVLLLGKAMLWCHLHAVPAVALAVLRGNPFPDATPEFFDIYSRAVNQAIGGSVQVQRPYALLSKMELMLRHSGLPFELTFSCIRPVDGKHCGRCNKCAERRRAFAVCRLPDPTDYQAEAPCTA